MRFPRAGSENTEATLEAAVKAALAHNLRYLVVASTRGETALKALNMIPGQALKLVVVTHNAGFKDPGKIEFPPEIRERLTAQGAAVYTGTLLTRGLDRSIKDVTGWSPNEVVSQTLRLFGQGTKVCLEIAAMACDAGLIPPEDIVAVAGTGYGADTAVIVKAESSHRFFAQKVREIICKPWEF